MTIGNCMYSYGVPAEEQNGLFPDKLSWKISGKITGWQVLGHMSHRNTHSYVQSAGHVSTHQPITAVREVESWKRKQLQLRLHGYHGQRRMQRALSQRKEVVVQTSGYSWGQTFKPNSQHKWHSTLKSV